MPVAVAVPPLASPMRIFDVATPVRSTRLPPVPSTTALAVSGAYSNMPPVIEPAVSVNVLAIAETVPVDEAETFAPTLSVPLAPTASSTTLPPVAEIADETVRLPVLDSATLPVEAVSAPITASAPVLATAKLPLVAV